MSNLSINIKSLTVVALAVLFGIAGCDSNLTNSDSPSHNGDNTIVSQSRTSKAQVDKSNEIAKELLAFIKEKGYDLSAADKLVEKITGHTSDAQLYQNVIKAAINGDKYQCGPTDLDAWASNNLAYANLGDALFIILLGIDQYPLLYSLIFEEPRNPRQSYGYNGEYTRQIYRASRSIGRFWDVNLRPVRTLSAKGGMLSDFDKVFALVSILYPDFSDESNANFSQTIVDLVKSDPIYNNGDAPIFSFNAFAVQEGPILVGGEVKPPSIVMGDGILDGMDGIGLGSAAPQAILAHEMSHHVQYQLNVFEKDTLSDPAKSTRRTELMADALAAYYLGHKRGAAFNWDRVETFMLADFNVGDCAFNSSGHHGTPLQRKRAGKFGFELAENARRRVGIMPASKFIDKFDAALPEILSDSGSIDDVVN